MVYKINKVSILCNRFFSLISEYGYSVALSIILAKISINHIVIFWIFKALGSALSVRVDQYLTKHNFNQKKILIYAEISKGILIISIPALTGNYLLFGVVFFVEILNNIFSSNLLSIIPLIVDKESISKFTASITFIGSISYFIAPAIVGLFINVNINILFILYSITLIGSSFFLFLLPKNLTEDNNKENYSIIDEVSDNNVDIFSLLKIYPSIMYMLISLITVQTVASFFDAFEIVYITQILKFSDRFYSYSLSFLAIVFLIVSFLFSFIKIKDKVTNFFIGGILLYSSYLLIYINSKYEFQILLSFILLGTGQTIFSLMFNNYVMLNVKQKYQSSLFIFYNSCMEVLTAMIVIITGLLQNFVQLKIMYQFILYPSLVIVFIALMKFKKMEKREYDK